MSGTPRKKRAIVSLHQGERCMRARTRIGAASRGHALEGVTSHPKRRGLSSWALVGLKGASPCHQGTDAKSGRQTAKTKNPGLAEGDASATSLPLKRGGRIFRIGIVQIMQGEVLA